MEYIQVITEATKGDMVVFTKGGKKFVQEVRSKQVGWFRTVFRGEIFFPERMADLGTPRLHESWYEIAILFFPLGSEVSAIRSEDVEEIILIPKGAIRWIDRAVDWANLNTDDDDCIWKAIYKYKKLRELNDDQQICIYELIAERLGL